MIIFTNLDSDFYKKFTKFYLLDGFTSVRWKPVVCMAILKTFSHFKHKQAAMQTHKETKKSSRVTVTKNPNPRHANQINNTNTTEHELKYPEASRSSFLKLVFNKLKP